MAALRQKRDITALLPALLVTLAIGLVPPATAVHAQAPLPGTYFPARDAWERRKPSDVGMDDGRVADAVAWAKTQETDRPKDLSDQERVFGRVLGPMPKERGGVNGVVLRRGYIIAEFGDTERVDPTYSVAKSYLSTLVGVAIDRGLVRRVTDPVGASVTDGGYDPPHNAKVTWEHHLRQTSEWEGTLFGKSHAFLGTEEFGTAARKPRDLREPGTYYAYNDVRVNRLALSLLRVWKRPLPEVLKSEVMDLIGASHTWAYHGYANSDVAIDGKAVKSVSGGTRWGGGLWMSTRDHARFGHMLLNRGQWAGQSIVAESWVRQATAKGGPGDNDYGYLWWLNTQGRQLPDAPRTSFAAVGAGSNTVWIDPDHDLVVVWRWHRGNGNEFYRRLIAAVKPA